jgi:hypothetical protein
VRGPAILYFSLIASTAAQAPAVAPAVAALRASPTKIHLVIDGPADGRPVRLLEQLPYERRNGSERPPAWTGEWKRQPIVLARFDGARDRLYSRFVLQDVEKNTILGSACVQDVDPPDERRFDLLQPKGIKGVQSIVDVNDALALGVQQAAHNVTIGSVVLPQGTAAQEYHDVDGEKIPLNIGGLAGLDASLRTMTEAGVRNYLILINPVPTSPDDKNPFIHPKTDLKNAPNHLGAFNLTNAYGWKHFRAALEVLGERYSRPDRKFGQIAGVILGNELQSHWWWHNLGRMAPDEVVADYERSLRAADLALRRAHPQLRVYVSLDHHWTARIEADLKKCLSGKEFVDQLAARARAEGDYPWDVAFHPYPEDLNNPRTWKDRQAVLDFFTPKITFKNLEVLTKYLARDAMTYRGQVRRVILSEQGFQTIDGPEGESLQAAAFAYAFEKSSRTPGVDAFIYHRHVDHEHEGGLRLGLWTVRKGSVIQPEHKKKSYDVFKAAGTPVQASAFEFAKSIIGINGWSSLNPAERIAETPPIVDDPAMVVANLVDRLSEAKLIRCADARADFFSDHGRFEPSLFEHPQPEGDAEVVYAMALPAAPTELRFATALGAKSGNGVRFSVGIDGKEIWNAEQKDGRRVERRIDLAPYAGKKIELALRVNAMGDTSNDWAHWVRPRVLLLAPAK